jgi:hypothetical protein
LYAALRRDAREGMSNRAPERKIYRRIINEHAMDDVSYQVVRAYVAKRKPEIRVEAFFEGHEHAFRVLGGVPFGKIRYDNLKAAVA